MTHTSHHRIRIGLAIAVAMLGSLGASVAHAAPGGPDRPAGTSCGATQRIQFAAGTDHGTVSGSFCEGQDNRFVLRAAAGQTMTVTGIEAGTAFSVIAPNGSTLPGGPGETISYSLPATGDYTILHGPRRSEVTTFEFTVTIPPTGGGTPPSAPRRISFAPGTDHGVIVGDVSDGGDTWVIRARAGQAMTFDPVGSMRVNITAPDGSDVPCRVCPDWSVTFDLPQTGDYVVSINPGMGEASQYSMTVTIPGPGPGAQRVQFPAGTFGTSLRGTVGGDGHRDYLLNAAAGRTMVVQIDPADGDTATITIAAPDGQTIAGPSVPAADGRSELTVALPQDGDYTVRVLTDTRGADYQIGCWIA